MQATSVGSTVTYIFHLGSAIQNSNWIEKITYKHKKKEIISTTIYELIPANSWAICFGMVTYKMYLEILLITMPEMPKRTNPIKLNRSRICCVTAAAFT
jgi:hypothetical protein